MSTLADYKRARVIRALVFGKFKTGKTAGAATWPRPLILDFDRGIATLTNQALEAKYGYLKNVVAYESFGERDKSSKGVPRTHNAFDDACRFFDGWSRPERQDQFDTWVIDSG